MPEPAGTARNTENPAICVVEVPSGDIYELVVRFANPRDTTSHGFLKSIYHTSCSAEQDDENTPPMKKAKAGPNGKCVAVRLGMNGKVTGRSIAYIAVLARCFSICLQLMYLKLWLSLTTATIWANEYYNVSLPQMYDFFVDYFEGPAEGTQAREHVNEHVRRLNFPRHII
jgi:hypothetical protein